MEETKLEIDLQEVVRKAISLLTVIPEDKEDEEAFNEIQATLYSQADKLAKGMDNDVIKEDVIMYIAEHVAEDLIGHLSKEK